MADSNPIRDVIRGRISAERFQTGGEVSDDELRELIEDAILAPSSFNIQHWRFVAVRDPEDKKRLRAAAYDQAVVEDAAMTLIVLGDLRGHEKLAEILDDCVDQDAMTSRTAKRWIELSNGIYRNEQMARDEAIRSATLASMVLMLSAAARGLATAPLIGFDPDAVRHEFEIPEHCLPVMLLAIGRPTDEPPRRKVRMSVDRILAFDRARNF
jgi:putative NAD(P)H nitroreductase